MRATFSAGGLDATVLTVKEPAQSRASEAMNRYAEGDDAAFSTVYDELAPRLHAYLKRRLGDGARADDALQHTFLQIHLHRGRFTRGARVEPWAYAIARAASIDLRRRERRPTSELHDDLVDLRSDDAPSLLSAQQLGAALEAELETVSPKLREAFLLVRVEGLSHAEAAQVLEITEGTTKVRTHRATQWLRARLSRFGLTEKAP